MNLFRDSFYLRAHAALERGEAVLAAQIIQQAPDRKSVRELRQVIKERLAADAAQAFELGLPGRTLAMLERAAEVGDLANQESLLLEKALAVYETWKEAKNCLDRGQYETALSILKDTILFDRGEGAILAEQARFGQRRFDNKVEKLERAFENGNDCAAKRHLDQLMAEAPENSRIARFAAQLNFRQRTMSHNARPKADPFIRIVLQHRTLLTAASVITIGTSDGAGIILTLQGAEVNANHAIIARNSWGEYYVCPVPSPKRPSHVFIKGRLIEAMTLIKDGDIIQIGGSNSRNRLQFRLPVADSHTAVIEMPQNSVYDRVVVLEDYCTIAPSGNAHLTFGNLPCASLTLSWQSHDQGSGLSAEVKGGKILAASHEQAATVSTEELGDGASLVSVVIPGVLLIEGDRWEKLGRSFIFGLSQNLITLNVKHAP